MVTVAEVFSAAIRHHQAGQLQQAEQLYRQVLQVQPSHVEAHRLLGVLAFQAGNVTAAIAHYEQALALRPDHAEAHNNLGVALRRQGRLVEAIDHYRQAIALNSKAFEAFYNLGNVFQAQQQWEAAVYHYEQAIAVKPDYVEAHCNLASTLADLGQAEPAIAHYRQALELRPNLPAAHYNLGNVLRSQDQWEAAIECYQRTIALNPDHVDAYRNLAQALTSEGRTREAIDVVGSAWERQLFDSPTYWGSLLATPIIYTSQAQIRHYRRRFCQGLNQLRQVPLETPAQRQAALEGLASHTNFYLTYQGFKDLGVQRQYGKLVNRVMAANYPQWVHPLPMPPLTGKMRVGYVSVHMRQHTVGKLFIGWLANHDRERFEIYSYALTDKTDALNQEYRQHSDVFYQLPPDFEAICQQILSDRLHILVFTDTSMDPLMTQLAGLRLAPIQCVTWGHPVTSGLPTIDYFLSSELMEPDQAQTHYSETLVCLPNIGICYDQPVFPQPVKSRREVGLPEDAMLYLSCQSLFKYLPRFDAIFPQIAQRVPQARFVFLRHWQAEITAHFERRLEKSFAHFGLNYQDFCIILPRLYLEDFLNLQRLADVYLDTLNWSGGNTTLEAIAAGLPVVTCPGEFMRSRHSYGILRRLGITETIAHDEAEYIDIAARLGLDVDWRQDIGARILANHSRLYGDRTCVKALEAFYQKAVLHASGSFENLIN